MNIQHAVARALGVNKDVIAYYDTDSVLARFDVVNQQLDDEVQRIFEEIRQYRVENGEVKGTNQPVYVQERIDQIIKLIKDSE